MPPKSAAVEHFCTVGITVNLSFGVHFYHLGALEFQEGT